MGLRAEYGKRLLPRLAESLTAEFGRGFDASNLRYMRLFYSAFPICDALRHELSWTHYRTLLRVEDEKARHWYSCALSWSEIALCWKAHVRYQMIDLSHPNLGDKSAQRVEQTCLLLGAQDNKP